MGKKIAKIIGCIFGILILIVVVYVLYVMLSYTRFEDHLALTSDAPGDSQVVRQAIESDSDREFCIITANIGFGAYDQEFDFFMDGGTMSWAQSRERVEENVRGMSEAIVGYEPDFLFLQEVDTDGTRSYHVDEYELVRQEFPSFETVYAQNYDSAFLFWPLYQPHGRNEAGLVTLSLYDIAAAERRSLPISDSFSKFLDLDRCYSISKIVCENGRELVLFNVHLSAYGVDASIQQAQREMLYEDMVAEYEKGNYVIVGGDFNHDMTGDSGVRYGNQVQAVESWAKPFDFDSVPEGFTVGARALAEAGEFDMAATCRDAGRPYDGTNDRWVLDAFIYSDNVEVLEYETVDLDFAYSDHNPVRMVFRLLGVGSAHEASVQR